MKRDIMKTAAKGEALKLGRADLTTSELRELAQIAFNGDVCAAICKAFTAGAYIGYKKGKESCRR